MKTRRTLVEYLDSRLGVHVGSSPELVWFCPVCIDRLGSESNKQKLHVNVAKGVGHCWRCEFGFRNILDLFRKLNDGKLRMEEVEIVRREIRLPSTKAADSVRTLLFPKAERVDTLQSVPLPTEMVSLTEDGNSPMAQQALRYLRARGVANELIERYQIGYCFSGRYAGYLVFPVVQEGEQVYFTTRFAGKVLDGRKSNNPPKAEGFHSKATCLLNYDRCVGRQRVAIVEGPFDMMAWGTAVALMGKAMSDDQLHLIDKLVVAGTQEIVVSLDSDAGKFAQAIYEKLLGRVPKVSMLVLPDGDPFDHRHELRELARHTAAPSSVDLVMGRYRFGEMVNRQKSRAQRV